MEEQIKALIEKYEKKAVNNDAKKSQIFRDRPFRQKEYFELVGIGLAYSEIISDLKKLIEPPF